MHTHTFMHTCVLMYASWMQTMHWSTRNAWFYTACNACINIMQAWMEYIHMHTSIRINRLESCLHACLYACKYACIQLNECMPACICACMLSYILLCHAYCSVNHTGMSFCSFSLVCVLSCEQIIAHMDAWIPCCMHVAHTLNTIHVVMFSLMSECVDLYNVM